MDHRLEDEPVLVDRQQAARVDGHAQLDAALGGLLTLRQSLSGAKVTVGDAEEVAGSGQHDHKALVGSAPGSPVSSDVSSLSTQGTVPASISLTVRRSLEHEDAIRVPVSSSYMPAAGAAEWQPSPPPPQQQQAAAEADVAAASLLPPPAPVAPVASTTQRSISATSHAESSSNGNDVSRICSQQRCDYALRVRVRKSFERNKRVGRRITFLHRFRRLINTSDLHYQLIASDIDNGMITHSPVPPQLIPVVQHIGLARTAKLPFAVDTASISVSPVTASLSPTAPVAAAATAMATAGCVVKTDLQLFDDAIRSDAQGWKDNYSLPGRVFSLLVTCTRTQESVASPPLIFGSSIERRMRCVKVPARYYDALPQNQLQ